VKRILHIVGARPNFMKIAPIVREMARYPDEFAQLLVHTGQHYDDNMSGLFFERVGFAAAGYQPGSWLGHARLANRTGDAAIRIGDKRLSP